MKRELLKLRYLSIRWEPRWPALGIGFYGSKYGRSFVLLLSPVVIEIGKQLR